MSRTPAQTLGSIGMIVWMGSMALRQTPLMGDPAIAFLTGITPNFGAPLAFAFLVEISFQQILNLTYNQSTKLVTAAVLLALGIASEVFHDLYLSSPFDPCDIITTLVALAIVLATPVSRHQTNIPEGTETKRASA